MNWLVVRLRAQIPRHQDSVFNVVPNLLRQMICCCFHLHCLKGIHNPFSVGVTEVSMNLRLISLNSLYYALSEKLGIKDKILLF